MYEALHPTDDKSLSIVEYVTAFTAMETVLRARCPICKDELKVVPRAGENQHFSHMNSNYCHTKNQAALPYRELHPTVDNPELERQLKETFKNEWKLYFTLLKSMIPFFSVDEFISSLIVAKKINLWRYGNIQSYQIPYLLAALVDFPPATGIKDKNTSNPLRKFYFRFLFDSSIRTFNDLWIDRSEQVTFWRVSFDVVGQRKKPKIEDIRKFTRLEYSGAYLKNDIADIHDFIVRKVERWIAMNL